jgi:four helix bundle protein
MKVTNHRDLIAYQKAVDLQQAVFETSKAFPREEMYALTDQCRRSSRSIGANIAEAWRKRRYEAHFVSKLTDADGENAETEHWLDTALKCGYVDGTRHGILLALSAEVGKLIGTMIQNASSWCSSVRS